MLSFLKNIFKKPEHEATPTQPESIGEHTHNDVPQPASLKHEPQPEHQAPTADSMAAEPIVPTETVATDVAPQTDTISANELNVEHHTTLPETVNPATALDNTVRQIDHTETESHPVPHSWAQPAAPVHQPITEHQTTIPEKVAHWTQGIGHAVKDKADELEMRAEIAIQEGSETVKSWAHHTETWVEGMADAVQDKVEELELRAHIIADEAIQTLEQSIDNIGHTLITDAPPQPERLPEHAEGENNHIDTPLPADAATDIDELNTPLASPSRHTQPERFQAAGDTPIIAAESSTVFAGDEEVATSWTARLARGLSKSRNQMAKSLAGVFGGGKIDEDLYEELETVLLTSDMGIEATEHLMQEVRQRVSLKGLKDSNELRQALKDAIYDLIKPLEQPLVIPDNGQPFVIMMAGINGAGKTTSIGKLAKYFQAQGKSVMLAAGDTFRAAAREQLQEWGARNGVTVISQTTGDSAAVCFDAVESAKAKGIDIVLADTAGRLPTQLHLMEEIKKVKRVLQKAMPDAPHEIIVVLDANIGQNAINQVIAFDDALGVTGLIVTKLDGTAKGGILAALASNRPIPVRYIGVGEHIDDLRPFNAREFVTALLDEHKTAQ